MGEDPAAHIGALAALAPGSRVGGYVVEQQIAVSGIAVVFRARDEALSRIIALKILAPTLASDEAFRQRFLAASRAVAAVDHPNIIPVYQVGEADGLLFIAMRYVSGGDLGSLLAREGPQPPARVAAFISQVASALDTAHVVGLVHGDVKPANILVDRRPGGPAQVYLSDFGMGRGTGSSASLAVTGTPAYLAPEQLEGPAVDGHTDQYALACVAYQLLTGAVPFERDSAVAAMQARLSEPPPRATDARPDLPGPVDEVLAKAMDKRPEARYSSCGEFADALREALGVAPYNPVHAADQVRYAPALAEPVMSPPRRPVPIPTRDAAGTWTAVIAADRAYYDSVEPADGDQGVSFPDGYERRRIHLARASMIIGRRSRLRGIEPDIDLAGDPGVSWLHAVLRVTADGTWSIIDQGSLNGTFVNGREIPVGEAVPLRNGDRIHMGLWTVITIARERAGQPEPGKAPSRSYPPGPSRGWDEFAKGGNLNFPQLDPGSSGTEPPDPGGDGAGPPNGRHLLARCQDVVPVGRPFSLLASIVQTGAGGTARLAPFNVPAGGRDVLLVLHAPGLRLLSDQRLTVHVPPTGDSSPVMFELRADAEGPRTISITAWVGGRYLGELLVEVTADASRGAGQQREFSTEINTEPVDGSVSLVVRYDPESRAYRFEFRDEDNPNEVVSRLSFEPRQRIEHLVKDLDRLAAGHGGYSADQVRSYLVEAGAELWRELIPAGLREQFWERQHRIRQLTILSDKDTVPWELLYPRDPGHDAGFLVQQFPVTRAIFGRRPAASLSLSPARFVLPRGSLPEAEAEIDAMRRLLDPAQVPESVIGDLTPLQDLIRAGDFGLLHFACHNRFEPDDDASIKLGGVLFTPRLLTTAVIDKVLARSAPMVFMNACRSAGLAPTYNRLDGWASKFLEAGAGAFIGSLWAVSDGTAREFAEELYGRLKTGAPLGRALMEARARAATHADDPTWLAYSAYGDPQAKVTRS